MRKQPFAKPQLKATPRRRGRVASKEEDCVVVIAETEAGERRILIPRSKIDKSLLYYLDSMEG